MRGKRAAVDARLDLPDELRFHLASKCEPLVRLADARHRAVHEHQLKVLRMVPTEFIKPPENCLDAVEWFERGKLSVGSSRTARRGCIRSSRRSSGSRRCGSPR